MALWQNPLQLVLIRFVMAAAASDGREPGALPGLYLMKNSFFTPSISPCVSGQQGGALVLAEAAAALAFSGHARSWRLWQATAVPFAGRFSAGGVRCLVARAHMKRPGPVRSDRQSAACEDPLFSTLHPFFPLPACITTRRHERIITLLRKFFPRDKLLIELGADRIFLGEKEL